MVEAAAQTTTIWIPPAAAIALLAKSYKSIAEEKLFNSLAAGRIRWDCLDLIIWEKRDSDPGRGDPKFWYGLPKSAVNLDEGWARRWEGDHSWARRLGAQLGTGGPPPVYRPLCDYKAVGIVFAREDVVALLPAAARAGLEETAPDSALADRSGTPAAAGSREPPPGKATKPEPPVRPGDSADVRRARVFLYGIMTRNPSGLPGKTKDDFRQVCLKRFKITDRRFRALWDDSKADSGARGYGKTGPRGPHKPNNSVARIK